MLIPSARRGAVIGLALVFSVLPGAWGPSSALVARPASPSAQAAAPAQTRPAASGEADPGVRFTRLIDRDEIRVSRIELEPGAARAVHAHTDAEYHVWTPVQGVLEFTVGTEKPVEARPGQAFFMTKGTRHGFRNIGSTPAAAFEIFVKKSTVSADRSAADVEAVLAGLLRPRASDDADR